MNKRTLSLGIVALAIIVIVAGLWVYDWVLGETEAASGPISAPTLAVESSTPVIMANTPTSIPEEPSPTATQENIEPMPTEAVEPTASTANAGLKVYQITQAESEVRFTIYEELRSSPKDVIGVTDQVAGEIAMDLNDLSTAKIGEIRINARTLVTDDDRRNQAIRNRILHTDQYEFITFTPKTITALSGAAQPGQSYTFQVSGNLTIQDVTQAVTFDVTVQGESENRITGSASTTISRAAFNLIVPNVPFVANVGDEIKLEIDFVLLPIQ